MTLHIPQPHFRAVVRGGEIGTMHIPKGGNAVLYEQIATDLWRWQGFFDTDAVKAEEAFHALDYAQRIKLLREAFGDEEGQLAA